jgi:TetR/AcrR family transcriptional regulator, transcriptional repressor for nem operon
VNIKHDREQVVQTGLQLFCSRGYNSVGLDEICRSTGMTKGAFYNAFGSKQGFLLETLASFDRWNTVRIEEELKPVRGKRALEQLKGFYSAMLRHQPKVEFMGCMINNMMSELGAHDPRVAAATTTGFEHIIKAVAPAVKRAQAEGDLDPAADPLELAALLHTTFYGALTRAKSLGSIRRVANTMNLLFNHLKPL